MPANAILRSVLALPLLLLAVAVPCRAQTPASCRSFTDEPVAPGVTVIQAQHVIELRDCIGELRAQSGLAPYPWTDQTLQPGASWIRAVHIDELRAALSEVYAVRGAPLPAYFEPLTPFLTPVRAIHLNEIRTYSQGVPPPCWISVTPATIDATADAGSYAVTVDAPSSCHWEVSWSGSFIQVTSATSGSGPGMVLIGVAANVNAASRAGTVMVGAHLVTIYQAGQGSGGSGSTGEDEEPAGRWRLDGGTCYFDTTQTGDDECQRSMPPPSLPAAANSLSGNRDRLFRAWAARTHPGQNPCDVWMAMSESEQLIFLTLTHRLSLYTIHRPTRDLTPRSSFFNTIPEYPEGDDLLSHIVDLYAIRPKGQGFGGGDNNRIFGKMDSTAYLVFSLVSLGYGAQVLTKPNDHWRNTTDLLGPHSPFDMSAETHAGESRGQVHFFAPFFTGTYRSQTCWPSNCAPPDNPWAPWGESRNAYLPLGRPGVTDVADPYVFEMDQDFGLYHDSDVTYPVYMSDLVAHWGDFDVDWHPANCATCEYAATPVSASLASGGGTVMVSVLTLPSTQACVWSVTHDGDPVTNWLRLADPVAMYGIAQYGPGGALLVAEPNAGSAQREGVIAAVGLSRYYWIAAVAHVATPPIVIHVTQSGAP